MSALIIVSNSDGVVGQCDAKCYDAKMDHCDCICGGMNHGAGRERALANGYDFDDDAALYKFAAMRGVDPESMTIMTQIDAFPFGNDPTTKEKKRAARRRRRAGLLSSGMPVEPDAP